MTSQTYQAGSGLFRIGLISDTHGLLRPEAVECLRGSDHILHAGDIGKPEILHALRELAPHFEHKLFLTATPHNGYPESFSALLELLDNQRFARSTTPDRKQLNAVMVRRMKSELPPKWDGSPRFPKRVLDPIEVPYTDEERAVLLFDFERPMTRGGQRVSQLMMWVPFSRYVSVTPLMARLLASVAPLVQTISFASAPMSAATSVRARSTASCASHPSRC